MNFSLSKEAEVILKNAQAHYCDSWDAESREFWRGVEYCMTYAIFEDVTPKIQIGTHLNDFQQGWNSGVVKLKENITKNWFL